MDKETCSICNGSQDRFNASEKRRLDESWEVTKAKKAYDAIKDTLKAHGDVWSLDEVTYLYEKMVGLSSMQSKKFRKLAYEVAISLQRTRKSIVWHYKHLFVLDDSPKAGEVLLAFKKSLREGK